MRLDRRSLQVVSIVAGSLTILAVGYLIARVYAYRQWHRSQAAYHSESERGYRDLETRLRGKISLVKLGGPPTPDGRELAEEIFSMLRQSQVGAGSREVRSWRIAPHSPARTAAALKWATVAADETAYMARLHEIWGRQHAEYRTPHHITGQEVEPFRMPEGWTDADTMVPGESAEMAPTRTDDEDLP